MMLTVQLPPHSRYSYWCEATSQHNMQIVPKTDVTNSNTIIITAEPIPTRTVSAAT